MNLVIVESPAKAKTIEKFLGGDYKVTSSYGHIRDLKRHDFSIDLDNQFQPIYEIPEDKKDLVSDLKKAAKKADMVWLASDEDREGEAISWHLSEVLGLDPKNTRRIVFHEITKPAILAAIENPRNIDMGLVNAQQARRVLDRIVGFELSPILWRKVKPALSAGRVQSVAVRLIVEREREIESFKTEQSYRVVGTFATTDANGQIVTFNAELNQRFKTQEEAEAFLQKAAKAQYSVNEVSQKPLHRTPAPPFTTSTLQQEASRKLGFSVARTMQIAQQLYESGYITYMRTDSVNLSEMALAMAKEEICNIYGSKYAKTRRYHTKIKGAQEAHEAIRPTYMENQTINADAAQRRLYELIWKRTIACQMADAEIEKTTIDIAIEGMDDTFTTQGEQILFDGFLKVYTESTDDEIEDPNANGHILPAVTIGQAMIMSDCDANQHYTQHPSRYTEASLVKKLEELGIGRPSTYAPTISTILKREYIIKEDREAEIKNIVNLSLKSNGIRREEKQEKVGAEKSKLFPTDIGAIVNQFLMEHFNEIMDYNFTATVEKEFDEIATGEIQWRKVIDKFYNPFHENILLTQKNSHRNSGSRLLGVDPKSGKNVYAKIGRYGTLIQVGETNNDEKPKFASMKKGQSIDTITLEDALALFALPRTVGQYEGKDVIVNIGKFGPYVRLDNKFYSLSKVDDPYEVTLERCIEIISVKRIAEAEKEKIREQFPHEIGLSEGEVVASNIGRYGPYLTFRGENYRLSKDTDPLKITLDEALDIIQNSGQKKPRGRKKKTETAE